MVALTLIQGRPQRAEALPAAPAHPEPVAVEA
jgi:hypothetical protein